MKHTLGPWVVEQPKGNLTAWAIESATRHPVAWIAQTIGNNQEENANARLIAAAPDLLEALHLLTQAAKELERQAVIVASRNGAHEPMLSNAATVAGLGIDRAKQAISKATGGVK